MEKARPVVNFVREIISIYQSKRASRSAAEFAYFLVLSIFPVLICIVAILAHFDLSIHGILDDSWTVDIADTVMGYLDHLVDVPSWQIIAMSLTVIAMSGSAAFRAMAKIMSEIQGESRYKGILGLVISFVFAMLLLLTVYFSVLMITSGAWLMEQIEYATRIYGLAAFWQRIRFVILSAVVVVVVHLIYLFTAPKDLRIRRLPGAIIATVALVIGSMIFSVFTAASVRYPVIYGSLASFVLLMIWCYLCGNIIIVGNVFNHVLHTMRGDKDARSDGGEG